MHQLETGPDNLVELRVRGRLKAEDYDTFVPRIERAIEDHGKIRLLVELGDMEHLTPGAVWEDLKFSPRVLGSAFRPGGYPWFMNRKVKNRRRGFTRVSAKHQVTLPVDALREAGIRTGDTLRAEVRGPGEVVLVRADDPLDRYSATLTGAYERGELDRLRDEWD